MATALAVEYYMPQNLSYLVIYMSEEQLVCVITLLLNRIVSAQIQYLLKLDRPSALLSCSLTFTRGSIHPRDTYSPP